MVVGKMWRAQELVEALAYARERITSWAPSAGVSPARAVLYEMAKRLGLSDEYDAAVAKFSNALLDDAREKAQAASLEENRAKAVLAKAEQVARAAWWKVCELDSVVKKAERVEEAKRVAKVRRTKGRRRG